MKHFFPLGQRLAVPSHRLMRGAIDKILIWKQYLQDNRIDSCCITETHLRDRVKQKATGKTEFHNFLEDQYVVYTKKIGRSRKGKEVTEG